MTQPTGTASDIVSRCVPMSTFLRNQSIEKVLMPLDDMRHMSPVIFDHVGGPFTCYGLTSEDRETIVAEYGPQAILKQLSEAQRPDAVDLSIMRISPEHFEPIELRGEPYHMALEPGDTHIDVGGPHFFGRVHFTPMRLQLAISESAGHYFVAGFANFLRVAMAYRMLFEGGLVLHSCAYVDAEDRAHVFFGHSRDGKSTLGHRVLKAGADVLSDDYNCISSDGGQYYVEGVPLSGELGHDPRPRHRYPLARLYTIQKDQALSIVKPSRTAFVGRLLSSTPFVVNDPIREELLWKRCDEMTKAIPFATLGFGLEDSGGAIRDIVEKV